MSDDKDEIAEDLGHHKEMLRVLRRRLRERELQEAKHGINVPDNITSEIHDITERIQRHESEIARLKSEVAEDKEPLAEVEYRALVAKAWDTGSGRPTVVGAVQLNLSNVISWLMEAAYINVDFLPNVKPLLILHEKYVNEVTDDEYWLDDALLFQWAEAVKAFDQKKT